MKSILVALLLLMPPLVSADATGMAGLPAVLETKPHPGQLPARLRTIFGLQLGKSGLEDVQKKFPGAEVFRLDSTDGASKAICIRSNNPGDDTQVMFEAGALGGFQTLTAVTVGPSPEFAKDLTKCIAAMEVSRARAVAGDIKLGGSLTRVAQSLRTTAQMGKAGLLEINLERFPRHVDKVTGKMVETEVSSGVVARVEGSRIVWFSIYFVEGS